jgi:hypothetical protein
LQLLYDREKNRILENEARAPDHILWGICLEETADWQVTLWNYDDHDDETMNIPCNCTITYSHTHTHVTSHPPQSKTVNGRSPTQYQKAVAVQTKSERTVMVTTVTTLT